MPATQWKVAYLPQHAPGSDLVYYVRSGSGACNANIHVSSLTRGGERAVEALTGRSVPSSLSISADGQRLAFIAFPCGGGPQQGPVLAVRDLANRTTREWKDPDFSSVVGDPHGEIALSADGRSLAFGAIGAPYAEGRLRVLDLMAPGTTWKHARTVPVDSRCSPRHPAYAPDGRLTVACFRERGDRTSAVYVLDPGGRRSTMFQLGKEFVMAAFSWDPSSRVMLFVTDAGKERRLRRWDNVRGLVRLRAGDGIESADW